MLTLKCRDEQPARRLEIFTGAGRRCEWLPEEKARIVAESYETAESVSAVARRYALSSQQLFAWRRAARLPLAEPPAPEPLFIPAVIVAPRSEPAAMRPAKQRKRQAARVRVEVEVRSIDRRKAGRLTRIYSGLQRKRRLLSAKRRCDWIPSPVMTQSLWRP
jgi:transposase